MKSIGIIGFGHFGKFLAEKLSGHFEIKVYSASDKQSEWSVSLAEVATCDFVVLSLPLAKHREVCDQLKPLLGSKTIIVDVCSIKGESSDIIRRHLPDHRLLSTHPLFGPESAKDSLSGHVIVLCPDATSPELVEPSKKFFDSLGLETVVMTTAEHDKSMAVVQGLTFFVARVLQDFNLHEPKLATPSFKKLMALAELEQHQTKELFVTIQNGNPYTYDVRQHFIERSQELQTLLASDDIAK